MLKKLSKIMLRRRILHAARRIRRESTSFRELQNKYEAIFKGRRCLIIGSAPDVAIPRHGPADRFICINGSPYAASQSGINYPDLTIMSSYTTAYQTEKSRATMTILKGLRTKEVLFIKGSDNECHAREVLTEAGFQFDLFTTISWVERAAIIGELCGQELGIGKMRNVVSNGVFATILALWARSDNVIMCGFSLQGGHNYMDKKLPRDHVDGDIRFYLLAKELGLPVMTTSAEISQEYGTLLYAP